MDVDQSVNVQRVLNRRVSEIENLGLQKLAVAAVVGFFNFPFPSLMLLLVMVVVVLVVVAIQE
jgi:hypothetical protein